MHKGLAIDRLITPVVGDSGSIWAKNFAARLRNFLTKLSNNYGLSIFFLQQLLLFVYGEFELKVVKQLS